MILELEIGHKIQIETDTGTIYGHITEIHLGHEPFVEGLKLSVRSEKFIEMKNRVWELENVPVKAEEDPDGT